MQLQERRAGNTAYQQQQYSTALHYYQRALAVVNFVVGQSSHDQAEVDYNKATVLLNMAAVHMALKVLRSHTFQSSAWFGTPSVLIVVLM